MVESPLVRALLRAATALVLAFIYLPLIILAVYAFNESKLAAWPPTGFTLHWFGEAAANPAIRTALLNSLVAATAATLIALVLGTLAALGLPHQDQADIARGWQAILARVESWRDLEPQLNTMVERLIDFVTQDHLADG